MIIKLISDIISFSLTVITSILFYNIDFFQSLYEINWILIIGAVVLFLFSIYNYGGYKNHVEFSQLNESMALINAAITTIIISIVTLFIVRIEIPIFISINSRLVFVFSLLIIPSFMRHFVYYWFPVVNNEEKENVLLIGGGVIGKSFLKQLLSINNTQFTIHGILDDKINKGEIIYNSKVIGGISELETVVANSKIDRVIVAVRHISETKLNQIRSILLTTQANLFLLPSIESFYNNPAKLNEYSGIPIISMDYKKASMYFKISKRILDIIGSLIAIIITLPLWPIIILLIVFDSKGTILFKQYRIGLNGEEFEIYKFRTMFTEVPVYGPCPVTNSDSRITKVGRWLRKTSLDELPQLLNILKGEMSLVGPRPEMPFQVKGYTPIEKQRWMVKPGLTGLWQITPHRNAEPYENPEFDQYYILNQSLTLDLVILVMTCFFIFKTWTH
jgi:exopolysaccharide biosynthesis polyprenyl glycosylphosphotransferase